MEEILVVAHKVSQPYPKWFATSPYKFYQDLTYKHIKQSEEIIFSQFQYSSPLKKQNFAVENLTCNSSSLTRATPPTTISVRRPVQIN